MTRPLFVTTADRLHRFPAFEECNLDDAEILNRYASAADIPLKLRQLPCQHCDPFQLRPPADVYATPETEVPRAAPRRRRRRK